MKTVPEQIVELVLKHDLTPGSTKEELLAWYEYGVRTGTVVFEKNEKGKVAGFLDWVCLRKIPKNMEHAREIYDGSRNGKVLFFVNCVSKGAGMFMRMRDEAVLLNPHTIVGCYHRKKDDRIVVKRRAKCLRYC
jgi:hypothetical protein